MGCVDDRQPALFPSGAPVRTVPGAAAGARGRAECASRDWNRGCRAAQNQRLVPLNPPWSICALVGVLANLSIVGAQAASPAVAGFGAAAVAAPAAPGPLVIDRGPGETPLLVPRDEELEFIVHIKYGPLSGDLGKVWLKSGVSEYRPALLLPKPGNEPPAEPKETGWVQARAKGGALTYESDTTLTAWHLPQDFPRLRYLHEQRGTEQRRHELLLGMKDSKLIASLRKDTDKGAPRGTRIWKDPVERSVPAHAIDMVSAGYLARQLFAGGIDEIRTTMIDKHKLWDMQLKRGRPVVIQVEGLGSFNAVELDLRTTRPASEPPPKDPEEAKFEGPFGIHGDLRIYLEASTGVPLVFEGNIPLGLLGNLQADIRLAKFRGTPPKFGPRPAPAADASR
jgi:Protein of unknown function (DUF3108)